MSKLWTVERKRHDGAWVVVNRWGSEDEAQRHAAVLGPDYRVHRTPSRRRWTVRSGTDGCGVTLFEVYATTMEEARASVLATAEVTLTMTSLPSMGFTVHAHDVGAGTLKDSTYVKGVPAPDFPRELANA